MGGTKGWPGRAKGGPRQPHVPKHCTCAAEWMARGRMGCAQSCAVGGSGVAPRGPLEFEDLIEDLKNSKDFQNLLNSPKSEDRKRKRNEEEEDELEEEEE